jgi:uroporphyrinogen-III synthase
MHVIVTRPTGQADAWLAALEAAGHTSSHLPLIDIGPATSAHDLAARQAALESLPVCHALMFVSSNAVEHFFKPNRGLALIKPVPSAIELIVNQPQLRYWATGPGTTAALLAMGVPLHQIDAPSAQAGQFDSEALWQMVKPQIQPSSRVLIVRGRDVGSPDSSRDWLAQQIVSCGAAASSLVVYERRAPPLSAQQWRQCQTWLRDGSVWLISSSQALRHLPPSLDASQAICICTHDRIAQAATARGFAVVCTSRPNLPDVLASIKSMHV